MRLTATGHDRSGGHDPASGPAPASGRGRALGVLAVTILATLPAACAVLEPPPPTASPSLSAAPSGLRGQVLVGPRCSGPKPSGSLCLVPYRARLVILDADGEPVTSVTTDAQGRFEVLLAPGTYTIAPVPGGDPYPTAGLIAVSVADGEFTDVEVRYDSGLGEGRGSRGSGG